MNLHIFMCMDSLYGIALWGGNTCSEISDLGALNLRKRCTFINGIFSLSFILSSKLANEEDRVETSAVRGRHLVRPLFSDRVGGSD